MVGSGWVGEQFTDQPERSARAVPALQDEHAQAV